MTLKHQRRWYVKMIQIELEFDVGDKVKIMGDVEDRVYKVERYKIDVSEDTAEGIEIKAVLVSIDGKYEVKLDSWLLVQA